MRFNELVDDFAKDSDDGKKAFICVADIRETCFVKKNLLNDEDGNRLGELGARFHDAQAEGNNLGGQQEVYDGIVVVLLEKCQ